MIASKKLSYGEIKILSFDKDSRKIKVQCGDDKPVFRKVRDEWFEFIGTKWLLGYDFGLKIDANGNLVAPERSAADAANDQYPFFVYGTLRKGMRNHYNFMPHHVSEINIAAKTKGELFHRNGLPYMFEGEDAVIGDIIHIKPEAYAQNLRRTDGLEGYFPNRKQSDCHYVRKLITCTTAEGEEVKAWAYFAGSDVIRNKELSDGGGGYSRYTRIVDGNFVRWYNEYERSW